MFRSKGRGGLLPEEYAFPILATLHRLCVKGSAGRCAVVYAFRSVFFTEWLIRQIEGRLDEASMSGNSGSSQVQPSLRHLVALLHALVLFDPSGAAAEKFGTRILALIHKAIRILEPQAESTEGDASGSLLEFALDSEGAEGGLGRAVRTGRKSADLECLKNLKELAAQLRPWEEEQGRETNAKLMSSLILSKGARSLKRSANEERGSRRFALVLGGHAGATNGVEIPEVDFKASESLEHGDLADDHERYPSDDLTELPLVAIRVICRRAATGPKEALAIALHEADGTNASKARDGLAQIVPWLIRCAGALSLNLEATILHEDKKPIASIYATRGAHLQLLEAALPTCAHLISGLRDAGLVHYRHTELCQTLLLLAQRLTSGLGGLAPRAFFGSDPEFRLLWRHCLVCLCRVFRLWFQAFPKVAGGQLLLPLLRHARVLPINLSGDLMLLATCGSLKAVLPTEPYQFSLQFTSSPPASEGIQSHVVLLPTGTRTGNHAVVTLRHESPSPDSGTFGQFHGDTEVQDWEEQAAGTNGAAGPAKLDWLVRTLAQERETGAAQALGLVELVNARRERLSLDDFGELLAALAESALTSDAFLHLCTAKVMEKLTAAGLPVLLIIRRLAEAALNGVMMETDGREGEDNISGGAARDPRDARAVSRLLMLLCHFGTLSDSARLALTEHSVETLCQSVLAHSPASSLPSMAFSQSIRLLGLMFSTPFTHSVPKCRMVAKAVNLLINKADSAYTAPTVSAALELLLGLCTPQWLCLNLLFSGSAEDVEDETVQVTTSSAFKLEKCMQRLAQELEASSQQYRAAEKGTEEETAVDELAAWLRATELMISLQRVVVQNCPSSTIFLEVVLENSSEPDSLFADVIHSLQEFPAPKLLENKAGRLLESIKSLKEELLAKPTGPLPRALPSQVFAPPVRGRSDKKNSEDRCRQHPDNLLASDAGDADAVVSLLDAAADLESNAEWISVVELDPTDTSSDEKMECEFDASALRKKRQDFLEKFESDRRAKRLKQQEKQAEQRVERADEKTGPPTGAPTQPTADPADHGHGAAHVKPEKTEAPSKKSDGKTNPAEALQSFLKDHPEFMRVLQNPKKCLADPRVKTMFVTELQNYPAVRSFLASKGLQLS